MSATELDVRLRDTAFALLVARARPLSLAELGEAMGTTAGSLEPVVGRLAADGLVDRDASGAVAGARGLTLVPGRHKLALGGAAFSTWCAYDAIGIPAALGEDARVATSCGVCGAELVVQIKAGRAPADSPERVWLPDGGANMRADFCGPGVLLCGPEHARTWAERAGGPGRAVSLHEAATLGRVAWAGAAVAARVLDDGATAPGRLDS